MWARPVTRLKICFARLRPTCPTFENTFKCWVRPSKDELNHLKVVCKLSRLRKIFSVSKVCKLAQMFETALGSFWLGSHFDERTLLYLWWSGSNLSQLISNVWWYGATLLNKLLQLWWSGATPLKQTSNFLVGADNFSKISASSPGRIQTFATTFESLTARIQMVKRNEVPNV